MMPLGLAFFIAPILGIVGGPRHVGGGPHVGLTGLFWPFGTIGGPIVVGKVCVRVIKHSRQAGIWSTTRRGTLCRNLTCEYGKGRYHQCPTQKTNLHDAPPCQTEKDHPWDSLTRGIGAGRPKRAKPAHFSGRGYRDCGRFACWQQCRN